MLVFSKSQSVFLEEILILTRIFLIILAVPILRVITVNMDKTIFSAWVVTTMVALLALILPVQGSTAEYVDKLQNDSLFKYNRNIRPVVDQNKPITVGVKLDMMSLVEFDEVKGEMTISAAVTMHWVDEFLKWNPADYGGIYWTLFENGQVWTPPLVIVNTMNEMDVIGGKPWQQVRILASGDAYYNPADLFTAACRPDVTYYPFDRHICYYSIMSWTYLPQEIFFKADQDTISLQYYIDSGAWTLKETNITVFRNETLYLNNIMVLLTIERQPSFIMVNFVIPIICMGFLNIIIFFIPADSGEKISYSITMLLSIAVFLTLVGDNLPKTSEPMAVFSYYLLGVLIMSILIILVTVFNLRIFHRDDESDPVKGIWLRLANFWKCKCRRGNERGRNFKNKNSAKKSETYFNENSVSFSRSKMPIQSNGMYLPEKHFSSLHHRNYLAKNVIEQRKNYLEEKEMEKNYTENVKEQEKTVQWKDVSDSLDKTCFVIFSVLLLTGTVAYFVIILTGGRSSLDDAFQSFAEYIGLS